MNEEGQTGDTLMLYDEAFISKLPEYDRTIPNPGVVWLCKQDGDPVASFRAMIETAFASFDQLCKTKFLKPLRFKRDDLFYGSLFELLTGSIFASWGYAVQHDPLVAGLTPDILVRRGGDEFICEVATLFDEADYLLSRRALRYFHRRLRREVETDYHIVITYHDCPSHTHLAAAKEGIRAAIAEQSQDTFRVDVSIRGLRMHLRGVRLPGQRNPGIREYCEPVRQGDAANKARDTLEDKAKRYWNTEDRPLVLAICDPGNTHLQLEPEVVEDALYGTVSWTVAGTARQPGGLFSSYRRDGQPRYRHVSGVLAVTLHQGPDAILLNPIYYANPNAIRPLPDHLLEGISRLMPQQCGDGDMSLSWIEEDVEPIRLV